MSKVYEYYLQNQEELEAEWADYVISHDWGSGEDKIKITDDIFFEWVSDQIDKNFPMEG